MQIVARTLDGKSFMLVVRPSDSVISVKHQIEELTGMAADAHELIFTARHMHDLKSLFEYRIGVGQPEHPVIYVVAKMKRPKRVERSRVSEYTRRDSDRDLDGDYDKQRSSSYDRNIDWSNDRDRELEMYERYEQYERHDNRYDSSVAEWN